MQELPQNAEQSQPHVPPLHQAARDGDVAKVKALLEAKADLNQKNTDGALPLHLAAGEGHISIVEILLAKKADPKLLDKEGRTPLDWAAGNGCLAVVKLLLDRNPHFLQTDSSRATPLHWAAYNGHLEVARELLNRGANPNSVDAESRTPLGWAQLAEKGDSEIGLLLKEAMKKKGEAKAVKPEQPEPVKVAEKPQPHAEYDLSPLHQAARDGDVAKVRKLLDGKADINKIINKKTPLDLALGEHSKKGGDRAEIIVLLRTRGGKIAEPNASEKEGQEIKRRQPRPSTSISASVSRTMLPPPDTKSDLAQLDSIIRDLVQIKGLIQNREKGVVEKLTAGIEQCLPIFDRLIEKNVFAVTEKIDKLHAHVTQELQALNWAYIKNIEELQTAKNKLDHRQHIAPRPAQKVAPEASVAKPVPSYVKISVFGGKPAKVSDFAKRLNLENSDKYTFRVFTNNLLSYNEDHPRGSVVMMIVVTDEADLDEADEILRHEVVLNSKKDNTCVMLVIDQRASGLIKGLNLAEDARSIVENHNILLVQTSSLEREPVELQKLIKNAADAYYQPKAGSVQPSVDPKTPADPKSDNDDRCSIM